MKKYKITLGFSEQWDGTEYQHHEFEFTDSDIVDLSPIDIAYLLARNEILVCGNLPNMDTHTSKAEIVSGEKNEVIWDNLYTEGENDPD